MRRSYLGLGVALARLEAGCTGSVLGLGGVADLTGDAARLGFVARTGRLFELAELSDHLLDTREVAIEAVLQRLRRLELTKLVDGVVCDRLRLARVRLQLLDRARRPELAEPSLGPVADRRGLLDELRAGELVVAVATAAGQPERESEDEQESVAWSGASPCSPVRKRTRGWHRAADGRRVRRRQQTGGHVR